MGCKHVRQKLEPLIEYERTVGAESAEVRAMEADVQHKAATAHLTRRLYIPSVSRQTTLTNLEGQKLVVPEVVWNIKPLSHKACRAAPRSGPKDHIKPQPSIKSNGAAQPVTDTTGSLSKLKLSLKNAPVKPSTPTKVTKPVARDTKPRNDETASMQGRGNWSNHAAPRYSTAEKISVLGLFPSTASHADIEAAHLRNTSVLGRTFNGLRQQFKELGKHNITVKMLRAELRTE